MSISRSAPAIPPSITVRRCSGHADFRACVELQIAVWKFDPIDVVSHHILAVAAETGGQVLGAFDGGRMVGFSQAFAAAREGRPYLHSHMLAVLPEYQSHGIGRTLKLAQREDAMARGFDRIEWTFDPLESRNAYFNLARLGAVVRRYILDFYGSSSSPLHANLPTDRLVAEWLLDSPRVRERLAGRAANPQPAASISIPRGMDELRQHDTPRAAEIQQRVRREFLESFARGLVATGFAVNEASGNYLLEKSYED